MNSLPETAARGGAIVLFCLFVVCDLALIVLINDWAQRFDLWLEVTVFCVGFVAAQEGLILIWTVLMPAISFRRFVAGLLAFGFPYLCVEAAIVANTPPASRLDAAASILGCLLLFYVVLQAPFWLMRLCCGWCLVRDSGGSQQLIRRTCTIRQLLWATAITALALATTRLVVDTPADAAYMAGVLMVMYTIVALPALALLTRDRKPPWGTPEFFFYTIAVTALAVFALEKLRQQPLSDSALRAIQVFAGAFACGLAAPLLLARLYGYRLIRGSKDLRKNDALK